MSFFASQFSPRRACVALGVFFSSQRFGHQIIG